VAKYSIQKTCDENSHFKRKTLTKLSGFSKSARRRREKRAHVWVAAEECLAGRDRTARTMLPCSQNQMGG
jgi:hypothetical protein